MRFSAILCSVKKLPKSFANFPERYIKKQTEFIEYKTPKLPWYNPTTVRWRKPWETLYELDRPWTQEFHDLNAPGRVHPRIWVEPVRFPQIFRGDRVEILRGKDKGKQGIVNYVVDERNWVCVEGLNLKRTLVQRTSDFPGTLNVEEMPLLVPRDVALVDPSDKKPTKIEWRYDEEGEQVRVSIRTGRVIPIPMEAFETHDYVTPENYVEQPKDTKAKDVSEVTFTPTVKTFEMDLMDEYGIKEDRIPHEFYWY